MPFWPYGPTFGTKAMMLTGHDAGPDSRLRRARLCAMALGMLGTKIGMTQVFDTEGKASPVTVLRVGPCPVLQVRDKERDGYDALQLGYIDKPRRKAIRA